MWNVDMLKVVLLIISALILVLVFIFLYLACNIYVHIHIVGYSDTPDGVAAVSLSVYCWDFMTCFKKVIVFLLTVQTNWVGGPGIQSREPLVE